MYFRALLEILDLFYNKGVKEFDSRMVSLLLLSTISESRSAEIKKQLGVKRISGDLDRLFRMGFLKRRRIKRSILVNEQELYRGFSYVYSFSAQGRSYVDFLHGKVKYDADKELDMMARQVHDTLPLDYRKIAEMVYDAYIRPRPKRINPRFPNRRVK